MSSYIGTKLFTHLAFVHEDNSLLFQSEIKIIKISLNLITLKYLLNLAF